jgi:hypothetical protein
MNIIPYQIDIGHAFLDGDIDEEIYIFSPFFLSCVFYGV